MILLDLINLRKIRSAILYLFLTAAVLWLQFSVLSRVPLPGAVKPFFPAAAVIAIGVWEGGVWGGVSGLLTGLYCDMNLLDSTVLCLLLFAALGFFSGVLADFLINRRFVAYMILTAAALLFVALCQIVPLWIFRGAPLLSLLPVALLQTLWSLPFAVPCYFLVKRIAHAGDAER